MGCLDLNELRGQCVLEQKFPCKKQIEQQALKLQDLKDPKSSHDLH